MAFSISYFYIILMPTRPYIKDSREVYTRLAISAIYLDVNLL